MSTLEASNKTADDNVATSPTIAEAMEKTSEITTDGKTETHNKTPEGVDEAKDQTAEATIEKVNEDSTNVLQTGETVTRDELGNEEISINIEVF